MPNQFAVRRGLRQQALVVTQLRPAPVEHEYPPGPPRRRHPVRDDHESSRPFRKRQLSALLTRRIKVAGGFVQHGERSRREIGPHERQHLPFPRRKRRGFQPGGIAAKTIDEGTRTKHVNGFVERGS